MHGAPRACQSSGPRRSHPVARPARMPRIVPYFHGFRPVSSPINRQTYRIYIYPASPPPPLPPRYVARIGKIHPAAGGAEGGPRHPYRYKSRPSRNVSRICAIANADTSPARGACYSPLRAFPRTCTTVRGTIIQGGGGGGRDPGSDKRGRPRFRERRDREARFN